MKRIHRERAERERGRLESTVGSGMVGRGEGIPRRIASDMREEREGGTRTQDASLPDGGHVEKEGEKARTLSWRLGLAQCRFVPLPLSLSSLPRGKMSGMSEESEGDSPNSPQKWGTLVHSPKAKERKKGLIHVGINSFSPPARPLVLANLE